MDGADSICPKLVNSFSSGSFRVIFELINLHAACSMGITSSFRCFHMFFFFDNFFFYIFHFNSWCVYPMFFLNTFWAFVSNSVTRWDCLITVSQLTIFCILIYKTYITWTKKSSCTLNLLVHFCSSTLVGGYQCYWLLPV